ncbi:MAG: FG-GAP repeat protein [Woeseia sp.]
MNIRTKSLVCAAVCGIVLLLGAPGVFALTLAEVAKLVASDTGTGNAFGDPVAFSGDTVVIGAPQDGDFGEFSGAAYVFTRLGTTWTQQAKLTASDAAEFDEFGGSVAISGDTVVIGAPRDDDAGMDIGSAYVFTRTGTSWTEQAKLTASDAAENDQLGSSVAVSDDTVVIGSTQDDDAGSAYVFTRAGTSWTEQAKLTGSEVAESDAFGLSVAVSGDTAVIGVPFLDGAGDGSGAAYVFTRTGSDWTEEATLTASDAAENDQLGRSVAVSGDTVVVGSTEDDDAGFASGSAYVFTRTGTNWTEQAKLTASDAAEFDRFGESVAVNDDTIVIGVRDKGDAGGQSGAAYVFTRIGTSWTELAKLTPNDGVPFDHFGDSVAVSGDTIVVGAAASGFGGSAYVFSLVTFVTETELDLKPFASPGKPNNIRLPGERDDLVKVAILSTNVADGDSDDFDALQVDPRTTKFGPNGVPAKPNWVRVRDVDGDGDIDLILRFKKRLTGITCQHARATLTGETYDGVLFRGSDSVRPFPCR